MRAASEAGRGVTLTCIGPDGSPVAPWLLGCSLPRADVHGRARILVVSYVLEVAFGSPDGAVCSRTGPDCAG